MNANEDPRIDPLLSKAVWLLGRWVPIKIGVYLCDRLGNGGLVYAEWDELIALGLAEYYEKDNGAKAHRLTRLGECFQQELLRQRREANKETEAAE